MYHVLLGCYPVSISLFPMRFSRGYFYKCLLADQTAPCPHGGLKLMLETGQGGEGVEEGSDYSPHTSSFSSTPQKRRKFILKPYGTYRYAVSLGGAPEPSSTLRVCWGALRLASSPHLAVAQFPSQVSLSHFCQRVSFLACTTCAALRCRTQYPH